VNAARDILQQLSAVGARIEGRGERLVICTGRRPVPPDLIAAARSAKPDLLTVLSAGAEGTHPAIEDAQQKEGEHLRCAEAENRRIPAALVEDAHANAFDERLRAEPSKMLSEDAHVSTFDKSEDFCAFQASPASKLLNSPSLSAFDESEHLRREWSDAEDERAAIVEHDGGIPRAWAEGFARLDPDRPPGDVPLRRWKRFIDDVGRFLDSPFCAVAAALGWGPFDLFASDRDRPFARIDQAGLLWLLNGDKLIALYENTATIETRTGARHTFRRRPLAVGDVVLAWELTE
jgi:hypothetical protein